MTRANPLSTKITDLGAPFHDVKSDDKAASDIAKVLESPINYTSYVMTWTCVGGVDSHAVAMQLLESLSKYPWDVKVVIAYAAFAINYGEFSLLTQSSDKTIATLKGISQQSFQSSDHSEAAVLDLLATTIKLTRCLIEFDDFPPKYLTLQPNDIPFVVYFIVRTLVVCASLLTDILCGHNKITAESKKVLSSLQGRLSPKLEEWQGKVADFRIAQQMDGKYIDLQNIMSTSKPPSPQSVNTEVLDEFFIPSEDKKERPLYDGSRKTNERLDVMRGKYVLLLLSDLEFPPDELNVLRLMHAYKRRHEYEILWIPVVDLHVLKDEIQAFYNLRNDMPWYSFNQPVAPLVIRYIRDELHFSHAPMLVVLDPRGKICRLDALPMMWIWGPNNAFPFTRDRERSLWVDVGWNIEFMCQAYLGIHDWISQNRVVCLYGGDDINWVRKFTRSAKTAALALNVDLEMLCVGKRYPGEKFRLCHEVIFRENLSGIFATDYYVHIWYFWLRLVGSWTSKKQLGFTAEHDPLMQGLLDLLTYDSSERGWAIFGRGSYETTMASGDKLVPVLDSYATWASEVDEPDKFVPVLDKNLRGFRPEHHCQRLVFEDRTGNLPERVVCTECGKTMNKYVMYGCCNE